MVGVAVVAVQPQAPVLRQQIAQQRQAFVEKLQIGAFIPGIGILGLLIKHRIGARSMRSAPAHPARPFHPAVVRWIGVDQAKAAGPTIVQQASQHPTVVAMVECVAVRTIELRSPHALIPVLYAARWFERLA